MLMLGCKSLWKKQGKKENEAVAQNNKCRLRFFKFIKEKSYDYNREEKGIIEDMKEKVFYMLGFLPNIENLF